MNSVSGARGIGEKVEDILEILWAPGRVFERVRDQKVGGYLLMLALVTLVGAALPAAGAVALPLAEFGLRKGDFVRVTVEAVDYRGPAPGQAATSGAIDLAVTDETGVLAALESTESQAAQELQTIIDDQLRVGDKP